MRKLVITFLISIFVLGGGSAIEAQCSKRILIYLDVSGSMKPGALDSPYSQTVDALRLLLQERNFLDGQDVVKAFLFGKEIIYQADARGPGEIQGLIDALTAYSKRETATDLGVALKNMIFEFKDDANFARQVVILASDLAHEPTDGMPETKAKADWIQAFSSVRNELEDKIITDPKTAFLVFQAPIVDNSRRSFYAALQREVRTSLEPLIFSENFYPVAGQASIGNLSRAIKRNLISDPRIISASRAAGNANELAIRLENPNCYPLTVTSVNAQCANGSERSDAVNLNLPSDTTLGSTGTATGTRTLKFPMPQGGCWQDDSATFEATVSTEEGKVARIEGTTGTWLRFRPVGALFEERPFGRGLLKLELEMTGVHTRRTEFEVEASYRGSLLTKDRFLAPRNLSQDTYSCYRIFLNASSPRDALVDNDDIEVAITSPDKDTAPFKTRVTDGREIYEWTYTALSILIALAILMQYLRIQQESQPSKAEETTTVEKKPFPFTPLSVFLVPSLAVICSFLLIFFRRTLLENFLKGTDVLTIGGFTLAAFLLVFTGLREIRRVQIRKKVQGGEFSNLDEYAKEAFSIWPTVLGLVLASFIFVLGFYFFKAVPSVPTTCVDAETLQVVD